MFRALADPTRIAVLERLSEGPAAVSELAKPHGMALPSFLQHLAVLEDAGLVRSRKEGRVRMCELSPRPLGVAQSWMARRRRHWEQRLDQLDDYLMRLEENDMIKIDPKLDLVLERVVDVPRELVWKAWTRPEHLKIWFTPAPWKTVECEIDLRPGGAFKTVMESPEGQQFPNEGCYLEVVENEKLVWTSTLLGGYRPARLTATKGHECEELAMTAMILLAAEGKKTKYTAVALHGDPESCKRHADMGFQEGWGTALDQLVTHAKAMASRL